ncbi:hypothetical protein ACTK4O_002893, partial [Listeria monocytogenes]
SGHVEEAITERMIALIHAHSLKEK